MRLHGSVGGPLPAAARRVLPAAAAAIAGAGLAALLASAGGCTNNNAVLGVQQITNTGPGSAVSLSRDVQPIFDGSCAVGGCHATPLGAPMSLEAGQTYGAIVNVQSCEAGGYKIVLPLSSAYSYLIFKLEGTQNSVSGGCGSCPLPTGGTLSGCGNQMPILYPALSNAEIQLISDWIDQGAANN